MTTPESMRSTTFSITRRGFDRNEVKEWLLGVADRIETLEARLEAASADVAPGDGAVGPRTVEEREFDRLGEAMASLLKSTHAEAVEARAEAKRDAETEAEAVRAEAAQRAADLLAVAEDEAADLLRAANDLVASLRLQATEAADAQREAAEADRLAAASLLDSTRLSAAALEARAQERAKEIIEQGKLDAAARADRALAEVHELIDGLRAAELEARRRIGQAHDALETALVAPAEWSESRAAHPAGRGGSRRPRLVAVGTDD